MYLRGHHVGEAAVYHEQGIVKQWWEDEKYNYTHPDPAEQRNVHYPNVEEAGDYIIDKGFVKPTIDSMMTMGQNAVHAYDKFQNFIHGPFEEDSDDSV